MYFTLPFHVKNIFVDARWLQQSSLYAGLSPATGLCLKAEPLIYSCLYSQRPPDIQARYAAELAC